VRYLFHVARQAEIGWGKDGRYAPPGLAREGFIHASYKDRVEESARLYFGADDDLRVLVIDARRLDAPIEVAQTPRGDMPHIRGTIPADAIRIIPLDAVADHPEVVSGTRILFLAFTGMTLLDLVGPLDALSRIASMGFDPDTKCEVASLRPDAPVWSACGLEVSTVRYRPPLDSFDVLVVPGGPGTRALEKDPEVADYIGSFPKNRLLASVCTGSLLLGAAGRLRGIRATTHGVALELLEKHGAKPVRRRVVDELQIVTAAGVTSGLDLGIHLVRRLTDDATAEAIAKQMEFRILNPEC
jgi:cyclohexyl-isocyanide hydratase